MLSELQPGRKRKLPPSRPSISRPSERARAATSEPAPDTRVGRRQRQPQISCDFCRHKKLKCDRARPCSNCVARGQACHGGPAAPFDPGLPNSGDILERLCRLEQAVFSARHASNSQLNSPQAAGFRVMETKPSTRCLPRPSLTELDYPFVGDITLPDPLDKFRFQLDRPRSSSMLKAHAQLEASAPSCILLPAKEDSLAMFEYFLRTSHCIPRTIHVPSVQSIISDFYLKTFHAQAPDKRTVNVAHAALILSICATTAFFWDRDASPSCQLFVSVDQAAQQADVWLNMAWDLLDQSRRVVGSGCLVEVQAHLILSDLVYNTEGCSTRFRYLHNRALAVSHEIALHLVDAAQTRQGDVDNDPITEVRRRLWWHIVSTDWLLSTMGGPRDRIYQVHPRHMIVNVPRNLNDEDMSVELPPTTTTDMTYFLLRIRLAEVCRKVVDILPLDSCDIDGLSYNQALAITRLFDDAKASMPSCFALDAPSQSDTPQSASMDRQIIHLAFHARLARILRPFLLLPDHTLLGRNTDPRCLHFRSQCLRSARSVLRIASSLLHESLQESAGRSWPLPLIHRSGCVISHMFMACVVLATDPALASTRGDQARDSDADAIRLELAGARQLLERVGEKSPMAASLVRTLIGVLRKRNVHAAAPAGDRAHEGERAYEAPAVAVAAQSVLCGQCSGTSSINAMAASVREGLAAKQQQPPYYSNLEPDDGSAHSVIGAAWVDSRGSNYDSNSLDDTGWLDFTDADFADAEAWGQLFADLDAAFPASM